MAENNQLVLVAAYQDDRLAQQEFDALVGLVKAKTVVTDGVILVAKDAEGTVRLSDTGDHLGRKGAGWGGGVGVVVGLFAPPMLASAVVGAAAGAVVGKFADHKLKSGLEDKLGAALAAGSAAVIAVLPPSSRLAAEQALPGSPAKSVVEMDGSSLSDLKASLAQAMGKFSPAKPGKGGKVTLWANEAQIGEGRLEHTVPIAFTSYAGMDIGRDNGLVVDLDYEDKAPYAFTGTIKNVVFDLKPAAHEAEKALHEHQSREAVAAGVAG